MSKTKDTIKVLEHMLKIRRITMGVYPEDIEALSHAIQIAQAQEQAEGMLPEKKIWSKYEEVVGLKITSLKAGFNRAIDIAQPILAKKILKNNVLTEAVAELANRFKDLEVECEEKDKRIKELQKVIYNKIREGETSQRGLELYREQLQSLKSKLILKNLTVISTIAYVKRESHIDVAQALIEYLKGEK